MKTDQISSDLIESDLRELGIAANKLVNHAFVLGGGLGFWTTFLNFLAFIAAIYLLVLDRTNWRTNMLTSLLVAYIFLSLPSVIVSLLSGEFGKWIAFIVVVLRLFFPRHFPDWRRSVILLQVIAPGFFADTIRDHVASDFICLVIGCYLGCYLLQEHIRASRGFRNSFTEPNGVSNTIGVVLILVYPIWSLALSFRQLK